jgi:hypothetical protein
MRKGKDLEAPAKASPALAPKLVNQNVNDFLLDFIKHLTNPEPLTAAQIKTAFNIMSGTMQNLEDAQIIGFQKQIGLSANNNGEFKIEVVFSKKNKS